LEKDHEQAPDTRARAIVHLEVEVFQIKNNEAGFAAQSSEKPFFGTENLIEEFKKGRAHTIDDWRDISNESECSVFKKLLNAESWSHRTIMIQAKRKYVANEFTDKSARGARHDNVKLRYDNKLYPTEEELLQIQIYSLEKKDEFEKQRNKEVTPKIHRVFILFDFKSGKIEKCFVDASESARSLTSPAMLRAGSPIR